MKIWGKWGVCGGEGGAVMRGLGNGDLREDDDEDLLQTRSPLHKRKKEKPVSTLAGALRKDLLDENFAFQGLPPDRLPWQLKAQKKKAA